MIDAFSPLGSVKQVQPFRDFYNDAISSNKIRPELADIYKTGVEYCVSLETGHREDAGEEPIPPMEVVVILAEPGEPEALPSRRGGRATREEPKAPQPTRESSRSRGTKRTVYVEEDEDFDEDEYNPAPVPKKGKAPPKAKKTPPPKKAPSRAPARRGPGVDAGFEYGTIVWAANPPTEGSEKTYWWPCVIAKPEKGDKIQPGHALLVQFGKNLTAEVSMSNMKGFNEGRGDFYDPHPTKNPIPEAEVPEFLGAVDEAEVAFNDQQDAMMDAVAVETGTVEDKVERILSHRPGAQLAPQPVS